MFAEIDTAIDGSLEDDGVDAREGALASDESTVEEVRRLFGQIAAHHATHLRDFVIELSAAPTGKAWVGVCESAIEALRATASKIQLTELVEALDGFHGALTRARSSPRSGIDGEAREAILAEYEKLRAILPGAFDVAEERDRREPVILQALFAQVASVTSLDLHRLYGAGAMSLSALLRAEPGELSAVTGIARERCAAIIERVKAHRRWRDDHPPVEGSQEERDRLRKLIGELQTCEDRFRAAEEAEDRTGKRALRRERLRIAKQIELVLTELGQVDLVTEIERLATTRKIARVERWLREPIVSPTAGPTGATVQPEEGR